MTTMMTESYRDRYKDRVPTLENKRVYIDHKAVTESFSRFFFVLFLYIYIILHYYIYYYWRAYMIIVPNVLTHYYYYYYYIQVGTYITSLYYVIVYIAPTAADYIHTPYNIAIIYLGTRLIDVVRKYSDRVTPVYIYIYVI